jgi:hypothetical protein
MGRRDARSSGRRPRGRGSIRDWGNSWPRARVPGGPRTEARVVVMST